MDPIALYGGLYLLNSSLATIVNVALDTKDGRKTLQSTLKELPILLDLLEELREGVLKTESSIPPSAVRAFRACQVDLDALILCLTQRGLVPGFKTGHEGFSELREKLSGSNTFYSKLVDEEFKLPPRKKNRSLKEKLNLLKLDSLIQAVKVFKDSVLLLRHIAMDFKTHHLLYSQALDQQAVLEELQTIHATLKQSPNTILGETTCQGEPSGVIAEEMATKTYDHQLPSSRVYRPNATTRHSLGALSTMSKRSDSPQNSPKGFESKLPEPETYPTLFNVLVAIPHPDFTPENKLQPQYICARTKLDTGSARNLISEKMVTKYRFEHLKRKLDERAEWTVGDGKNKTISDYTIELTWYNTHDSMRSYVTKFYVVLPDMFDLLLGEEHYRDNGVPGYTTDYYLGFFDLVKRPREQRHNEKVSMKTAEAQARARLQQEREALANSAHALPVVVTPAGQLGAHSTTTEGLRRTEQQIISESGGTNLSPVPEQDHRDSFMTPAIATPPPELASKPVVQQEAATASTNHSPYSEASLSPDSDTARQQNLAPSLNASLHTIEVSGPQTPTEETSEKKIFVAVESSDDDIVDSLPAANPKMEEINTVHVPASNLETSAK